MMARERPTTADAWKQALWHLFYERVDILNLLGEREKEQAAIDRLERWLRLYPGQQRTLDLLIKQTRIHIDTGNLNQAFDTSTASVKLAEASGDRKAILLCLEWRAMIHRERSEIKDAMAIYDEIQRYVEQEEQLAPILHERGLVLCYAGRLDEAQLSLERAIELSEKYCSADVIGTCYNDLGINQAKQGNQVQALLSYLHALGSFQRTGYKLGMAMAAGNIADIQLNLGEYQPALASARSCLQWGVEVEDLISQGFGHEMLGRIHAEVGDAEPGAEHLATAAAMSEQTGDDSVAVQIFGKMVEVLSAQGRADAALLCLEKLERLSAPDDPLQQGHRLTARANIARASGDHAGALRLLDEVLGQTVQPRYAIAETMLAKAAVLLESGRPDQAGLCLAAIDPAALKRKMLAVTQQALAFQTSQATGDEEAATRHRRQGAELIGGMAAKITDPGLKGRIMGLPWVKTLLT